MTSPTTRRYDVSMLDELLPVTVQGIIGHVRVYGAQEAWWAYCVRDGRMTAREEARLKRLARHRLEQYIAGKLREQRLGDKE